MIVDHSRLANIAFSRTRLSSNWISRGVEGISRDRWQISPNPLLWSAINHFSKIPFNSTVNGRQTSAMSVQLTTVALDLHSPPLFQSSIPDACLLVFAFIDEADQRIGSLGLLPFKSVGHLPNESSFDPSYSSERTIKRLNNLSWMIVLGWCMHWALCCIVLSALHRITNVQWTESTWLQLTN